MGRYQVALGKGKTPRKKGPETEVPDNYHLLKDINFEIKFGFDRYKCALKSMVEDHNQVNSRPCIRMEITRLVNENMVPHIFMDIVGKRIVFKSPLGPEVELRILSYIMNQDNEEPLLCTHTLNGEITLQNVLPNRVVSTDPGELENFVPPSIDWTS